MRLSLQARQEALSTAVARLLVQNNETERQAAAVSTVSMRGVERIYWFVAAMLVLILLAGLYGGAIQSPDVPGSGGAVGAAQRTRAAADRHAGSIFRSISRELHDDFGQILTAVGSMLQRTGRLLSPGMEPVRAELREVQEIVQSTLDKVRTLSHSLHPVILDEIGFEALSASISQSSEADRHSSAV